MSAPRFSGAQNISPTPAPVCATGSCKGFRRGQDLGSDVRSSNVRRVRAADTSWKA